MATDKRLDQVSTLTDFDYALIVKGDQVAKASKQQLAELVGNLLYGATNASSLATVVAGVMGNPAGTFANNFVSDCNEISANGYYPFVTKPLNAPEDISTGSVLAFVSSSMKVQYFFTDVEARVYSRRKWYGNDWSPWQRIDNFGYNTLADLSSAVAEQMKFINFEATCIHVSSIVYVQVIQTKFKNSVFGKYILKTPEGMLSEVLFSSEVDSNGYFSLGFESGLPIGSTLLVMYGG